MSQKAFKQKFQESLENEDFGEFAMASHRFNLNLKSVETDKIKLNTNRIIDMQSGQTQIMDTDRSSEIIQSLQRQKDTEKRDYTEIYSEIESNSDSFGTSNNSTKFAQNSDKTPKKPIKYGLIIFICSTIFLVLVSFGVYNSASQNAQTLFASCQQMLIKYSTIGVDTNGVNCQLSNTFENILNSSTAQNSFNQTRSTLEEKKKNLQTEITSNNQKIEQNLADLKNLQVDVSTLVQSPVSTNLQTELDQKKAFLASLEEKRTENLKNTKQKYQDIQKIGKGYSRTNLQTIVSKLDIADNPEDSLFISKAANIISIWTELTQKIEKDNPKGFLENFLKYSYFTPDQWATKYENINLPHTTQSTDESLTGDTEADQVIIKLAEERGYQKRQIADEKSLVVFKNMSMQSEVKTALTDLFAKASKDGIRLTFTSAYRSPLEQKNLFISRFNTNSIKKIGRKYTNKEIIAGKANNEINQTLEMTAIPGYSKHHSGFAVDLIDNASNDIRNFGKTPAFKWLSQNNYLIAKMYGFVPSYPSGVEKQGPNPEPWEFIWIGTDKLVD